MENKNPSKKIHPSRVFFKSDGDRINFFNTLKVKFGTWKNFSKIFGIYKSKLERYRYGEHSMPKDFFDEILLEIDSEKRKNIENSVFFKDHGLGRKKAGRITYSRHKRIFEIGRKIASANAKPKYHFDINMPLSPELCELIGAFIGDGFTNRYGGNYIVQFTGHSVLDRKYFSVLTAILKGMSPNCNPLLSKRGNTLRLTINSKEMHLLLTKRFRFPAGLKTYTVQIPDEIVNSGNLNLINRCIRGIFDTDGGVYFDKRKSYKSPYIRIGLQILSRNLIGQIYNYLQMQGINPTLTRKITNLQVNGRENCKKFIETIGFSNRRHLDKIENLNL